MEIHKKWQNITAISSNDSSKAFKPTQSTRRYFIMGHFLCDPFLKMGLNGKFRLSLKLSHSVYTKLEWLKFV